MTRFIEPVSLAGELALLEPLERAHREALVKAASDGELWKLWYTSVPGPDSADAYIQTALAMREHAHAMPFVVRERASGEVVGCTRFFNVEPAHRRLEIGFTWYARRMQRTALNTECKLLMLRHAFDVLACIAVEFRTHWMNHQSRAAISRLGAKQDGILRNHQIAADGSLRDTVVFSITSAEWPAIEQHLRFKLGRI